MADETGKLTLEEAKRLLELDVERVELKKQYLKLKVIPNLMSNKILSTIRVLQKTKHIHNHKHQKALVIIKQRITIKDQSNRKSYIKNLSANTFKVNLK